MAQFLGINPDKKQEEEKPFEFESLFAPKNDMQPIQQQPMQNQLPPQQPVNIPEQDKFMEFDPNKESTLDWGIRNLAGFGKSAVQIGLGLPGSMLSGGAHILGSILKKLPDPAMKFRPEGVSEEKWKKELQKPVVDPSTIKTPSIGGIELDPTIKGVGKAIDNIFERFGIPSEYLKPQTEGENTSREVFERIGSLMHPVLGAVSLPKAVLGASSYYMGKGGAKAAGLGKTAQEVVGNVLQAFSLAWSPKKLKKTMGDLFDTKATKALDEAKVFAVNPSPLTKHIMHPEKYFKNRSDLTIAEKWIQERANGIANSLRGNKIEVEKLWNLKKSFNAHVGEFRGNFKKISPFVKKTQDVFNEMMTDYGKKYNKDFLRVYKDANSMYAGFNNMPKILKTLDTQFKKNSGLATLGLFSGHIPVTALGKAFILKNGIEMAYALKNSPAIMKYAAKGLVEASKQNVKGVLREFSKADKVLEKKYPGVKKEVLKNKKQEKQTGKYSYLGIAKP